MSSATFENVTKRYAGGDLALDKLSLHVHDGELMVIVGPSGCGKSTALRLLAGLDQVTEGEIWIGDRMVNDVPTQNREVSMVFQNYALYPHLSAFENMSFGLRMQGMAPPEIFRKVRSAAAILDLVPVLDRMPRELSGGEQQRVALGRAIVRDPQLFLFDEPLSSIDAKLREHMRLELRKIHRRMRETFVYVTHDQVEAMSMADRIAVLRDGVLQQVGSPGEIYDSPANMFVAGFIGSPSMNFIPVQVSGRTAKASSVEIALPFAPQLDQAVLGIRPEALREREFGPDSQPTQPAIDLTVDLAEVIGSDQFVYGTAGDDELVARLDSRTRVRRGQRLRLWIDPRHVHVFDTVTNRALS